MLSCSFSVLTPQTGANLHCEWIILLHFHLVSYMMESKYHSQESDSKKSRKTVPIEKKVEVLDHYTKGEVLSDCSLDRTEGEYIAYH
ncbi:hypothetical protein E2C01_096639 [Portunus trituberculatus]|uniref:Uncharacterized protein n=1 Tax=Portunus trituberculatus TaxID=210409 RepID=A0A5B7K8S6_PORTR|nr:hypothetical protein [Portunus trituberculatus]